MNNTSARGVFGVLVPISSVCKRSIFMVLPKCEQLRKFCSYNLKSIPHDAYQIFLHDIEHNGLLSPPFSSPAVTLMETMLGSKYVGLLISH